MDSNLLKEAIADAKAVRQTALANAKAALEEAFDNRFQAMLAPQLQEETDDAVPAPAAADPASAAPAAPTDGVETSDIADIIKELEADLGKQPEDAVAPAPVAPAPVAPEAGAVPPSVPPVPPVASPVPPAPVAPEAGAVSPAPVAPAPAPAVPGEAPEDVDEEIDINELLESFEKEEKEKEEEEKEKVDESVPNKSSGVGSSDNKKPAPTASKSSGIAGSVGKEDGLPTPEGGDNPKYKDIAKDPTEAPRKNSKGDIENTPALHESYDAAVKENGALKQQLKEAEETLVYLKGQLNEINLLNAKLLYTNKLFKEYSMDNDKKMKIVEMFDLAKNVREVKMTYAVIAESLNFGADFKKKQQLPSKVQTITESMASRPVNGSAPKQIIAESAKSEMVEKFQKLAGISK